MTFEEHVRELENLVVVVEDEDPEDRDLFGLWQSAEFMPDKITIFRKPLVEAFPDPRDLEEEIRITVLHELAHYFGIDEGRLDELGYS
jgi:predicted Zn-dependent protease with MMP-like domain